MDDSEETIEEKTKNEMFPPLHLNPEFFKPGKSAKPSFARPCKYKKKYKLVDTHFGRKRLIKHVKLPISKYG